ncbi:monovalent cation/H(+) antiporter subunit G [Halomarina salina]|uniref:Monovalent cation/H(+) antiporter subunit G n=1 Tax=Halomarina salina TaxID=1872699 RepID=A0ABD5RIU5_9EURY|nr:monovalent cation/H(+) antiporter subunit G [Halomarina salina]
MTLASFTTAGSIVPLAIGPVRATLVALFVLVGAFFLLVGTVGLLRLPDVYNRMHATSKATTLGAASMFLACVAYFGVLGVGLTALVGIVFLYLTAPTGAHVISRSAQKMGVEFAGGATWPGGETRPDEPADAEPESDDD